MSEFKIWTSVEEFDRDHPTSSAQAARQRRKRARETGRLQDAQFHEKNAQKLEARLRDMAPDSLENRENQLRRLAFGPSREGSDSLFDNFVRLLFFLIYLFIYFHHRHLHLLILLYAN
jgi:hypothetical protein